jgi:hypothetical protein
MKSPTGGLEKVKEEETVKFRVREVVKKGLF